MSRAALASALLSFLFVSGPNPARADVLFDGFDFVTPNNGSMATINRDGTLTLSPSSGGAEPELFLPFSPPYASLTYVDNANTNIDLMLYCCIFGRFGPSISGIMSGSESSFSGIGEIVFSPFAGAPTTVVPVYSVPGRVNGAVHTVSIYEAPDGTVYEGFDGATYRSSFLADNREPINIDGLLIMISSQNNGSGNSVTLLNFQAAATIPEPASVTLILGGVLVFGWKLLSTSK